MNHGKQPVHNPTYMSSCEKVKKLRQIVNVEKFNTTLLQVKQNRKDLAFFKYGQTGASSDSLRVTVKIRLLSQPCSIKCVPCPGLEPAQVVVLV